MVKLLNAFTPAMLPEFPSTVSFFEITDEQAKSLAAKGIESCVGHMGAAEMYQVKLGVPVLVNRVNTKLEHYEVALIGQYTGPRLPEGKVMSPEEMAMAPMKWLLAFVVKDDIADIAGLCMDYGQYFRFPDILNDVLYARK